METEVRSDPIQRWNSRTCQPACCALCWPPQPSSSHPNRFMERLLHFFQRFRNLAPHTLWKHDWCWFNSRAVSSSRRQTAGFCVASTRSVPQRLLGNAEGQERTGRARRMFFLAGSQPFPHVSGFCCSSVRSRSSSSRARRAGSPRPPPGVIVSFLPETLT